MEESKIYSLLYETRLDVWKECVEKHDVIFQELLQNEADLKKAFKSEEQDLLKKLCLTIEDRIDFMNRNLLIKVLNFGIQTGTELGKAFYEFEE